MEGYKLSATAIKSVFRPIPEEIHINSYRHLAGYIPRGLNFWERYWCNRYFFIGMTNQALDKLVKENVINFVHRWLE